MHSRRVRQSAPGSGVCEGLIDAIENRLSVDWYSQNYIGRYLISSLPTFILHPEEIDNIKISSYMDRKPKTSFLLRRSNDPDM